MRRVLAILAGSALLTACGGLDNVPLTLGVVKGSLAGASGSAQVAVVGHPELSARPASNGAFSIEDVPQGDVELLLLVNDKSAERRRVTVTGGGVTDVGAVSGRPALPLEVELFVPDLLSARAGVVRLAGTAISQAVDATVDDAIGEAHFALPEGCYRVRGEVPGLRPVEGDVCLDTGNGGAEVHLLFASPRGTEGEEGCSRAGCLAGALCRPDGRCELP